MEPRNPYMPPGSQLSAPPMASMGGGGEGVSAVSLEHLRNTKPWVRLLSVMGFIGSALLVIVALAMMVGSSFMGEQFSGAMGVGLGVAYLLFALFYIYPSVCLWRYANSIQALLSTRRTVDLETALGQQKSFWRFVGILMAFILVIYALIFVVAIVAGAIGAFNS